MNWILTAAIGALMGGLTLLISILFLRFPRNPINLGVFRWRSLIDHWTTRSMEKQASEMLFRLDLSNQIRSMLLRSSTQEQAERWVIDAARQYITSTLPEKWPMVSMLIGDKTQDKVLNAISDQIRSSWKGNVDSFCKQQLLPGQIHPQIIRLAKLDQPTHWSERIWSAIKKRFLRLLVLAMCIGSVTALLGTFLYGCISNN